MSILIKVHESPGRLIVSLCDKSLLGKKFEENDLKLNVNRRFYEGKVVPEAEMIKIIKEAMDINAVGEESIDFLIKNGFVSKSKIRKISNIPIATVFAL